MLRKIGDVETDHIEKENGVGEENVRGELEKKATTTAIIKETNGKATQPHSHTHTYEHESTSTFDADSLTQPLTHKKKRKWLEKIGDREFEQAEVGDEDGKSHRSENKRELKKKKTEEKEEDGESGREEHGTNEENGKEGKRGNRSREEEKVEIKKTKQNIEKQDQGIGDGRRRESKEADVRRAGYGEMKLADIMKTPISSSPSSSSSSSPGLLSSLSPILQMDCSFRDPDEDEMLFVIK